VRVPSRFEEDGLLVFSYFDQGLLGGGPANGVIVPLGLAGDASLRPEKLVAWEAGHRIQAGGRWVFDTTVFYNDYRRLIGVPPSIIGTFTDEASGATWGGEFSASAQVTERWRLQGAYSLLRTRIEGPALQFEETATPESLAQLRSWFDLGDGLELNAALYRVGEVRFTTIPAYTRADLGLTWRARPGVEVSLWGYNLLHDSHREASGAEVPRGFYAQVAFGLGR
jgi:iron complex outermembrane receptor protein